MHLDLFERQQVLKLVGRICCLFLIPIPLNRVRLGGIAHSQRVLYCIVLHFLLECFLYLIVCVGSIQI